MRMLPYGTHIGGNNAPEVYFDIGEVIFPECAKEGNESWTKFWDGANEKIDGFA